MLKTIFKRKGNLILLMVLLAASLSLASCSLFNGDEKSNIAGNEAISLGTASYKMPDLAKIVKSEAWRELPTNEIMLVFKDGVSRTDAEETIKSISGNILGEIEFINMYQVGTTTTTEKDLLDLVAKAKKLAGVELAFPNIMIKSLDIKAKMCSPLNDPLFGEKNNSAHYGMVGVQDAWDIIKASKIDLGEVKVGVMDTAIYKGKYQEFDTKDDTEASGDFTNDPEKDDQGNVVDGGLNHGTMVSNVIGANANNGGMVGIASALGNKLKIKVTNMYQGKYRTLAPPDPNDPTKEVLSNGKTYINSTFANMVKQIESGATIINCSFGPEKPGPQNADIAASFNKFLSKMAQKYPKVLFVAAAGNEGRDPVSKGELNGNNYSIGGQKLPNVITVGALDNNGGRAVFSNHGKNGEVQIAAPGVRMAMGVGDDGKTASASGTSFAAPQVAACAALIRSINPNLSAEEIKNIIISSGSDKVKNGDKETAIPAEVGGKVLRVDNAVLTVINQVRKEKGLPELNRDYLLKLRMVDVTVKGVGKEYTILATLPEVDGSTGVSLDYNGECVIEGKTKQTAQKGSVITWKVSEIKDSVFIKVKREDTQGCASINLPIEDLSGTWTGKLRFTRVNLPPEAKAAANGKSGSSSNSQECEGFDNIGPEIMKALAELPGKEFPIVMNITPRDNDFSKYTVVSKQAGKEGGQSSTYYAEFDGTIIKMSLTDKKMKQILTGTLIDKNQLSGDFTITSSKAGSDVFGIFGTWEVTRPEKQSSK